MSVRTEKLGSHWTDFHEILYFKVFRKCVEKIQGSLKSDKNNGYFTCASIYIYNHISFNFSYNENASDYIVGKIKTHILCAITLFFQNRAVYEIMWKNSVEPQRPQIRTWRIGIALWIPKATNTPSEYITHCF